MVENDLHKQQMPIADDGISVDVNTSDEKHLDENRFAPIEKMIRDVSRRQWRRLFFYRMLGVFFVSEIITAILLLIECFGDLGAGSVWMISGITLSIGAVVGLLAGLTVRFDHMVAARLIDSRFELKDRVLTALSLNRSGRSDGMARLQLDDTLNAVASIRVSELGFSGKKKKIVPSLILMSVIFAICLAFSFIENRSNAYTVEPIPELVRLTEEVRQEILEPVEFDLPRTSPKQEQDWQEQTNKLQKKLEEQVQKLEENMDDPKEMLAALSEMEEAIRQTLSQFDTQTEERALSDLGSVLSESAVLTNAGKAMKAGRWSDASKELQKADLDKMNNEDRKKTSSRLKKLSKDQKNKNRQTDSNQTERLANSISAGDNGLTGNLLKQLSDRIERYSLRKGICRSLQKRLAFLCSCKSNCSGCCANGQNGGQKIQKSNKGGKNSGKGRAGDPRTGQDSKLSSTRRQNQLNGMSGEGPSEIETLSSDEAAGNAVRPYSEVYREYKKKSESVLESEPIPLGNRQIIRRYFESIRPHDKSEDNNPEK